MRSLWRDGSRGTDIEPNDANGADEPKRSSYTQLRVGEAGALAGPAAPTLCGGMK
jgi:hypothetical protein